MNLDTLEAKIAPHAESAFWAIYLVIPLFIGLFAFNWLPNESYDAERHELIKSHITGDVTVYDVWRSKDTGAVFKSSDFEKHRQAESLRMAYVIFMYGLIGCAFYAFRRHRMGGQPFTASFLKALSINVALMLVTYFSNQYAYEHFLQ